MQEKIKEIQDITVIGTGNVAYHLVKAFLDSGLHVAQVVARTEVSARKFSSRFQVPVVSSAPSLLTGSDLYVLAVSDDRINDAARALKIKGQLVVHTAGTVPMGILNGISSNIGVFYPIQTLSFGRDIDNREIPLCIEANTPENLKKLEILAGRISDKIYLINSEQRKILHLAAVFASNFTYHMYTVAARILEKEGIDPGILYPLILETAHKAVRLAPGTSQTGPAARKDQHVIGQHLELLRDDSMYKEIYQLLSESISRHHKNPEDEL